MTPAQRKCSAYNRELLAMCTAAKRFRHAVEGTDFAIYRDDKPLTYALNQNFDERLPWQFWRLDYIVQFTTNIRCIKKLNNTVVEALSRIEAIGKPVDDQTSAAAQEKVAELGKIVNERYRASSK